MIKTYRPITPFERIKFGENDPKLSSKYKLKLDKPIDLYIHFNINESQDEELTIETDQNLQKYFFTESDGDYLKIKLDSYDLDNMTSLFSNELNAEKNKENILSPSQNVRVDLKLKKSYVYLNKFKLNQMNVIVEPNWNFFNLIKGSMSTFNYVNTTVSLNCNNVYTIDDEIIKVNSDTKKISTRNNLLNNYLSIYYCDESFALYLTQTLSGNELKAFKDF